MAEELNAELLSADPSAASPPRIRLSEQGFIGLKSISGQILEESNHKLRMPFLIKEIDEMKRDSTVASALSFYKMMLGGVKWKFKAPVGASKELIERTKFLNTCMNDMDHSWFDFIQNVLTSIDYGFSVHEKVFKQRTKNNSKYDDGLIGWKALPIRAQQTLYKWHFTPDGRALESFEQSFRFLVDSGRYSNLIANGATVTIPRDKFLLFRTNPQNDNPEGTAALKASWIAWRMKKEVEAQEQIGLGRDLGGLLNISIPAAYMSPDATPAQKAVYEEYKRIVRNVANGEQSGIVIPSDCDSDTKMPLFKVDLLTSQGSRGYDTNAIIARLTSQILVSLFADLLQLGTNSTGSFALAGSKESLISQALDFRLREIKNVIDNDLIVQTFKLNKWDCKELPEIVYETTTKPSMEELSKFVQRCSATNSLEKDRQVLNIIRETMGADPLPEDTPPQEEYLGGGTSKSGKGLESGMPSGTGDATGNSGNSSDTNSDNTA